MSNRDLVNLWIRCFEEVQEIIEYEDLNREFRVLLFRVELRGSITDEENKKLEDIITINWQRALKHICDMFETGINNRKTKGQNFNKILKYIRAIRRKSEKNLEIDMYSALYVDLMDIGDDIKEKISIEKYQKNHDWKMLIFGFILGVLSSVIGGYIII